MNTHPAKINVTLTACEAIAVFATCKAAGNALKRTIEKKKNTENVLTQMQGMAIGFFMSPANILANAHNADHHAAAYEVEFSPFDVAAVLAGIVHFMKRVGVGDIEDLENQLTSVQDKLIRAIKAQVDPDVAKSIKETAESW